MPKTPSPNAEDVLTQLVTGPSIREVAATALRPELDRLYPQLQIDPTVAIVVTPTGGSRVIASYPATTGSNPSLMRWCEPGCMPRP